VCVRQTDMNSSSIARLSIRVSTVIKHMTPRHHTGSKCIYMLSSPYLPNFTPNNPLPLHESLQDRLLTHTH
jgi:hypothetical protein